MSEFQQYDFRRIDKPLSAEEKKTVESLSSHIQVSAQKAMVNYSYGDFKHNEDKVVEQFFDVLLYQANWGQLKLVFKFPLDSLDYAQLSEFDIDFSDVTSYTTEIRVWKAKGNALVSIEYCDDNFNSWIEENDNSLDAMLGLRAEIMNGDFSCLYAFWLKLFSIKNEEIDTKEFDYKLPSIPLGISNPSSSLKAFVEYFNIDLQLIKAAGTFINPTISIEKDYSNEVSAMDDNEKNEWLLRLISGEPLLDIKLKKKFTETKNHKNGNIKKSTIVDFKAILAKIKS